ncbi:hypothetical protein ACFY04_25885 [Streptomyces sp. NPDC001549]|uniref:hypothetical protein n=1 Tax=Streptomyces sp. NPDC001549 TaxID=3364586 RepID=UPI0036C4CD71
MSYTVKYNRTTNHIGGLTVRTTGDGKDMGDHVSYYAENACGSLTRYRFADGASYGSLADALEGARKGGRKLCKTCEKAAEAQLAAEADQKKEEGGRMATKLKMSEVRGDVMIGGINGSGTPHAIEFQGGKHVAICGLAAKAPLRSFGLAREQKPDFELCARCSKVVPTGPVVISEEMVEIPGLGRKVAKRVFTPVETDSELDASDASAVRRLATKAGLITDATRKNTTNEETATVAATAAPKMTKADQSKAAEEIRASIERLPSLIAEGKADAVTELREEIKTATEAITGTGAAGLKASLRADAEKAVKDAEKAKKDADKAAKAAPKAEVVNLATKSLEDIKELPALYALGVEKVKAAAKKSFEAGTEVAEINFKLRTNCTDKDGDPDLGARQQITRDSVTGLYKAVEAGLPEMGTDTDADIVRDKIEGVKTDAQRAMHNVQVRWVRALDIEPDEKADDYKEQKEALEVERAKFANALEMFPEGHEIEAPVLDDALLPKKGDDGKVIMEKRPIKWSERVFAYYEAKGKKLRTLTRGEEQKQKRAIDSRRKAELTAAVEAGEMTQEEADASLSAPAEDAKAADPEKRAKNAFHKLITEVKKIEDEKAKEDKKDELIALLASIRKEINEI